MSFVSRALGVHINPIKNQYSGFGNAMRDVAYAVAAYYAAPLLLGGGAASAAGGAGSAAGAAGGAGALTEFSAPEIAAMGGGLTTGAAGAGIGAGAAGGAAGGAGPGASGFMKYARLAQNMPSMGGGQQAQPMRDWTQPANDYMPKTQAQLLAEALAKQQNADG